jgi:hypothetical protein
MQYNSAQPQTVNICVLWNKYKSEFISNITVFWDVEPGGL